MKMIKMMSFLFVAFLFTGIAKSCSSDGDAIKSNTDTPLTTIIPANLTLSLDIVGANNTNPYGDGSGVVDQIDLSGVITGAFSYLEEAQAFTNTGSAQAFYDSNSKILQIDADGDAQVDAEMEIKLTTVTGTLDNTDFITGT